MITLRKIIELMPDGEAKNNVRQFSLGNRSNGKPLSVKKFANSLGFNVERVNMPRGMAGKLVFDYSARNSFRIEVNNRDDILKQRFTVLHEIGHYFLHKDITDPFAFDSYRDASASGFYLDHELAEEREANEFAAALLFDDGALRAAVSMYGANNAAIGKYFGVSSEVVRIGRKQFL